MGKIIRTYSELLTFETFEERFEYLKLSGKVGVDTFGFDRYINQILYKLKEWKSVRRFVINRDRGCDLGVDGYDINGIVLVHHMNPLSKEDIVNRTDYVLNPEYLITTTLSTHNAIHYGGELARSEILVERSRYDTCPWKK